MPAPPPPPPPPPPPALGNSAKPKPSIPKANGGRAMLLNEIHKGTRLKKTVTNDRSAPSIGGRVAGEQDNGTARGTRGTVLVQQKTMAPKPATINESLGALFAGGFPRKPSDVKNQKAAATSSQISSTNEANDSKAPSTPVKKSPPISSNAAVATSNSSQSLSSLQSKIHQNDSQRNGPPAQSSSATSLPPPLPMKLPGQKFPAPLQPTAAAKIPTSQQNQFQTLRPIKNQSTSQRDTPALRRSESNEEIQKRPVAPPALRRPGAPPPPPPPMMMKPKLLPTPQIPTAPAAVQMRQRTNNEAGAPAKMDAPPPPPPPRVSSYLESMEQRFHFVPLSELPPPPMFVGFFKDYGDGDAQRKQQEIR